MRLNSKGQVTIPAPLRKKHGLHEGDEVEVVEDGKALRSAGRRESDPRSPTCAQDAGPGEHHHEH